MKNTNYYLGIDIGSTTVKYYMSDEQNNCLYSTYVRHYSDVGSTVISLINKLKEKFGNITIIPAMTGSGGLSLSNKLGIPFVQEVIACTKTIETYIPETDVAIELGGEDAKITYFGRSLEQRMNGTCAGGTGAFIDQMATLLQTDATGLNQLAKNYKMIYPIASRCGVFAKTDIQPLINEGANKEDIAASIFQAVVNQTISGLAQGKPIRGKVALLGGPLYFLSSLRERFIETLGLDEEHIIFPENSELFVAMGACLLAKEQSTAISIDEIIERFEQIKNQPSESKQTLPLLFNDEKQLEEFRNRHNQYQVKRRKLSETSGPVFLGIDVGSTTTKAILLDQDNYIVYSFYGGNEGNPLDLVAKIVLDIYQLLPEDCYIASSGVTGYGEALIKAALRIDVGEVETIAHFKAAKYFNPDVNFILDIGGQDMKAIKIKDGTIESILLNEACSSGCGSFLETFAKSLNLPVHEFAQAALLSKAPIDLGSRCTVFMNSKVKQAQKEGASISDISAGLSYSVIKNALYKVIKLRRNEEMGKNVIVQGGTFYNEAVLRAFELETDMEVIRPNIAGLMGSFGVALIAKKQMYEKGIVTTLKSKNELLEFSYRKEFRHCQKCTNNCSLTVTIFNSGDKFVTGNRCEKGASDEIIKKEKLPNLYDFKLRRVFNYRPLPKEKATRGVVGIPRVLNIYEDYPFWYTFFTKLGFRVLLSPSSTKEIYELGIETIPSESVCYPAKLVHGHIEYLIKKDIDFIFYPSVAYEVNEHHDADNHFSCPIVTSYPEVIKNNLENIEIGKINYKQPFLSLNQKLKLKRTLLTCLEEFDVTKNEISQAVEEAYIELESFKEDVRNEGERVLQYVKDNHKKAIVLAGRPYHIDPEINHGIPSLIESEGFVVISEDSIAHLATLERPIRVVDQWMYHTRLYKAAEVVTKHKELEFIQLTSFGCGLDAITSDQASEILASKNKLYTIVKIDEGSNLGAIRIRVRSLKASIKEREENQIKLEDAIYELEKVPFTKEMKQNGYTILCPQMSPIHFQFIEAAMRASGYNFEVLEGNVNEITEAGLKYVNNDACYPSILVVGQLIHALQSGKYDVNKTAVIISQTGGGCRATNYIAFIRKALKDASLDHIPVISANLSGFENNPGFTIGLDLAKRVIMGCLYGDLFMRVLYRVRPYEKIKGSANALYNQWRDKARENVVNGKLKEFKKNIYQIVKDFDELALLDIKKPRVGLVGEILVKFHPVANNYIVDLVEQEGGEAIMPDLIDFFQYCFYNANFKYEYFEGTRKGKLIANAGIQLIEFCRKDIRKALRNSKRFSEPGYIDHMAKKANEIVSVGNQTGEGWFLTAEMIELIEEGAPNIVCMQPFACLPNHVTGKGVIKALRKRYPTSNIVAIDYDPGASESNQLNRIKLMLSTAFKNMKEDEVAKV